MYTALYLINMIGYLEGQILEKRTKNIIIGVSGIGYIVNLPKDELEAVKESDSKKYWIYSAARENSIDLFGFETKDRRDFFELLLNVPGVGPRNALNIISIADLESLKKGIGSGDTNYLFKVSGIGKKTAEKIVVELKDKIGMLGYGDEATLETEGEALDALISLGYKKVDVKKALSEIDKNEKTSEEIIKEAIKVIGNGN